MSITAKEFEEFLPDATKLESDEPEMESTLHYDQLALLVACLEFLWRDRTDFMACANLTIYFSRQQLRNRDYRGPDFFLIKQTEKRPRRSWVVWEEDGKYPNLIIELLSPSTEDTDRNLKKLLYQDRFRTPEYFWFSPDTLEFMGFRLSGNHYVEIPPNDQGWRWSEELQLFLGVYDQKLRYFSPKGELIPTPSEAAIQEQQQVEQERQRVEEAQQRAEQLAERLRSLGINPDKI
jgi:Uma2 family endonuclease